MGSHIVDRGGPSESSPRFEMLSLDRIVRAGSDRRSDIVRLMTAITISTGAAARFEGDTHAQPSDVVRLGPR